MLKKTICTIALLAAAAGAQAQAPAPQDPKSLIRQAFVYSFPLHEMGKLRLARLGQEAAPGSTRLGQWSHLSKLAGPADRWVTAPNNDTLYSSAWLDLANGPVKLSLPDTQGRYYSVALLDAYTNNTATLGRRMTGTRAAEFVVVGPQWQGALPQGSRVVRAATDDVLVLVRLLADGEADLPKVHALQDQLKLTALSSTAARPLWKTTPATDGSAAQRYLSLVNEMLERDPPPPYEKPLVDALAAVGMCGARCSWSSLSPQLQQLWASELPGLLSQLKERAQQREPQPTGWTGVHPALGNFGTDYGLRAMVALVGLLALEPAEAIYPSAWVDRQGQLLEGSRRYRLRLPVGGLPVDAFWSLTMYQVEQDGRLYLTDSAIKRYAIGNRTPGLRHNADGSLDIHIQHAAPTSPADNWLPAPAGRFVLMLRAYQPRAEFLDGHFQLPAVERLD